MSKIQKHLLWGCSAAFTFVALFRFLTSEHLEITKKSWANVYHNLTFGVLCLSLTIIGIVLPKDSNGPFGRVYVLVGLFIVGLVWTLSLMASPFINDWTDTRILYQDKNNPDRQIIERVFYAGAIGSDKYDTIVIRNLTKNIRWKNEFNDKTFKEGDWLLIVKGAYTPLTLGFIQVELDQQTLTNCKAKLWFGLDK